MKNFLVKHSFPIILIAISIFICFVNYEPGTFLSGWDTLHPEFNFPEYFKRILFGVWQTHQGLGSLSSQAHPSELPRMLIYYSISLLVPLSFVRYTYFFLTLILGPLGVYFFIKKTILKENSMNNKIASFGGALFYLLNLGTVQHYYVPFEMFATHFATIGWLLLFIVQLLEKNHKKDLFIFAIITFFAAPIAHTPTLWYIYFSCVLLFLFIFNAITRNKQVFLNSLKIIFITVFINLFWILPNLYFIATSGKIVSESKIHSLFTQEAFAKNKQFGTIQDILIFKNFLFDWGHYIDGIFAPLLNIWITHLNKPFVLLIGYSLSVVALIGLVFSIFKKHVLSISLFALFLLTFFFLLTTNPPSGFLFRLLQNNIPFFREAIRFPFTKFSIIFIFTFSVYFAWGLNILTRRFNPFPSIIVFICLIYYMLPAFLGNLISPSMKIRIPSEYFLLFEWFGKQQEGRIATLPIHSFWGWNYYSWGYQGAGFLWFGMKNPLLNREFDRWNPKNEQYYREMSDAIYSQNSTKLESVINKYDISYILLDKSIIAPENGVNSQTLFFIEIEDLLTSNTNIQKVFHSGTLFVYQVNIKYPKVRVIENPPAIGPDSIFYDDFAYSKYHDYITYSDPKKNTIFYPFRDLIDNKNRLVSKLPFSLLPDQEITLDVSDMERNMNGCPSANSGQNIRKEKHDQFIRYFSLNGAFCDHYPVLNLTRDQGYLISITSKNIEGLPLRLCIVNYISKRCDLYTHLSDSQTFTENLFLLPPANGVVGFDINFNNFAVKKNPSINDIKSIKIIPFPYKGLSQIEQYSLTNENKEISVITFSESFEKGWKAYDIKLKTQNSKLKTFVASYFPMLFGEELEHVLVNNWENGWVLQNQKSIHDSIGDKNQKYNSNVKAEQFNNTDNSTIVIVFLPQYLEYLGFVLLIGTFVALLFPTATLK